MKRYMMLTLLMVGVLCGAPPDRRSVLDGEMADADLYPYLAHLEVLDWGTCSASLIAMDWVITAAHCVVGADEAGIRYAEVSVGWSYGTQYRRVSEVWVHPRYTGQDDVTTTDWDVALIRLTRPVDEPAAPVRLGSRSLSALVQPGEPVVIIGDAGVRGRPMHTTIVLEDCPAEAGNSPNQVCYGRPDRPVISRGDSGGPLLVGDREGGARLMGVASTGATFGGEGWGRWTRIEPVADWILSVMLIQGTEGRSNSPSCAMPPSLGDGDTSPVGGRIFKVKHIQMCVPLGDTGDGVLFDYRRRIGEASVEYGFEHWFLAGASDYLVEFPVKDTDGTFWMLRTVGLYDGYFAKTCEEYESFEYVDDTDAYCGSLVRGEQAKLGVSLDLSTNSLIHCDPNAEP